MIKAKISLLILLPVIVAAILIFQRTSSAQEPRGEPTNAIDELREELKRNNMPDLSGVVVSLPKAAKAHIPYTPRLAELAALSSVATTAASATLTSTSDIRVTTHPAAQNETSIALDLNSAAAIGGANDYRDGDAKCGLYQSDDSGSTWPSQTMLLPNPSQFNAAGDPSVSYAGSSFAFYGCLGFHRQVGRSGIYVYRRDSNGNISNPTQVVFSINTSTFHDKPYIAANPSVSKAYVSWTRFDKGKAARIAVAGSADNGTTFNSPSPKVISDFSSNQGSSPAVASNGTVYVAWQNYNIQRVLVDRSTNGGSSWGSDRVVANISPIASPLPGTNFRTNSFPSMGVSPTNPDRIYVTWADYRSGNADILFARCDYSPTFSCTSPVIVHPTLSTDQFFPWLSVAPDGSISIVYYSRIDTTTSKMDVYVAHSRNDGVSFSNTLITDVPTDQNQGWGDFIGDYNGVSASNSQISPLWTGGILDGTSNNQDVFTDKISVTNL